MSDTKHPPDVVAVFTLRDGGRLETWLREGTDPRNVATALRLIAEDFEQGTIRRLE